MISVFSDYHPDAVVLAAGDFPRHPFPHALLEGAERIVCCDGAAAEFVERMGRMPWRIVGDGDSLSAESKMHFADVLTLVPEQETNDLTKATLFLQRHGVESIAYLGATGKREDHSLGNISLLAEYLRSGLDVRMYTDYGVFIPCHDDGCFEAPCGTKVSIFSFGARHLHSEGLKYPLHDLANWWQGTLNEVESTPFSVKAEGDYLVFCNYPRL